MLPFANWRTLLTIVAVVIVIATIFYSRYLANKISGDERQKVEAWAESQRFIAEAGPDEDILFATVVIAGQQTIPVIETNENDSITNYHNLDSSDVISNQNYLSRKLIEFKANQPIVTYLSSDSTKFNKYYYGESLLLKEVRYYPFIQLLIVALFILLALTALNARHRSIQNQLWAGMAKETAHQLGTPVSALQGWVEMFKETYPEATMVNEMEKDVDRLKLVSDRFSKIGSTPRLEQRNLVDTVRQVMNYVKKRAPDKIQFNLYAENMDNLMVPLATPLFDWVIENILKNALDAMEGKGFIKVTIQEQSSKVTIDITDSGKGMLPSHLRKVFNPGFTTKKRGWGLGLTLSKRIIEQYQKGELFIKFSEPTKGTTFRIIIPK
jgi:signal transduction histidine kinase